VAGDAEAIKRCLAGLVPEYREAKAEAASPAAAPDVVELPIAAAGSTEAGPREGSPAAGRALDAAWRWLRSRFPGSGA